MENDIGFYCQVMCATEQNTCKEWSNDGHRYEECPGIELLLVNYRTWCEELCGARNLLSKKATSELMAERGHGKIFKAKIMIVNDHEL